MLAKRWFLLAIGVQLLILFSLIGVHSFTQMTGEPVMLKTAPRDPWDPFRGEYVVLSYEISRLEVGTIPMEGEPYVRGQRVWVTLAEGNPYWTAVAVSDRRPQTTAGQLAVRGTVEWMSEGWGPVPGEPIDRPNPERPGDEKPVEWRERMPGELFLRYGIEQFYVPEGEGPGLERPEAELTVEALVDRFGRIALRKVFVDGKEIRWQ